MVVKKPFKGEAPSNARSKAGVAAEKQMAFYLNRGFAEADDIFVYNNLRFVRNDEVAQIDHLVLHRYGFTLIESKSITGKVEVNRHLEFVRVGRKREGMKSPITQVEMQAELLQNLLNDDKESLRRKILLGMVQAEFGDVRFTKIVAISDNGEIIRKQCSPPELMKADRVVAEVRQLIKLRDETQGFSGLIRRTVADKEKAKQMNEHDIAPLTGDELLRIHDFIRRQHRDAAKKVATANDAEVAASVPAKTRAPRKRSSGRDKASKSSAGETRSSPERSHSQKSSQTQGSQQQSSETPPRLREIEVKPAEYSTDGSQPSNVCQHCGGSQLRILYGPYGYYFECMECHRSTNIAVLCSGCGAKARVSKRKLEFSTKCKECGRSDHFHTNPS